MVPNTNNKQDHPGGSWGVKKHHTTQHQLALYAYCRVFARLGVVFVELYLFPRGRSIHKRETPLLSIRSIVAFPILTPNRSALWYDLDKNDEGIIDEAVSQLEPDDDET